jgi:hypothetical protein
LVGKKLNSAKLEHNQSGLYADAEVVACSIMLGTFIMHLLCVFVAPNLTVDEFIAKQLIV